MWKRWLGSFWLTTSMLLWETRRHAAVLQSQHWMVRGSALNAESISTGLLTLEAGRSACNGCSIRWGNIAFLSRTTLGTSPYSLCSAADVLWERWLGTEDLPDQHNMLNPKSYEAGFRKCKWLLHFFPIPSST